MACCVFTAYFMSRIIQACELFDVRLLDIKYNNFDPDFEAFAEPPGRQNKGTTSRNDVGQEPLHRSDSSDPFTTLRLSISGMTCSACVSTLTQALTSHPAVFRVNISLALSRATIVYDRNETTPEDLMSRIVDAGYDAEPSTAGKSASQQNLGLLRKEQELRDLKSAFNGAAKWATAIASVEWLRGQTRHLDPFLQLLTLGVGCHVQLCHARWIHRNAWAACFSGLKSRRRLKPPNLSMDTLLSLSLLLSVALSMFNIALQHGLFVGSSQTQTKTYFASASFLTVVISGGRYLDLTLKRQGAAGLARLFGLQREMELGTVMVESSPSKFADKQGQCDTPILTPIPTSLLAPLDTYHITVGSLIACDSYVVRGVSLVDESSMTGESIPVRKTLGDFLMSGTRNLSDDLVAVVLKEQQDSSLERLVDSVESATEVKYDNTPQSTGSDTAVEIMTRYFVSIVLLLSCVGFLMVMAATSDLRAVDRVNRACERSMAMLAAACPCAIGLATPSAVMAGVDACYARGALLPGGSLAIENLARLTHLVLDKTGTLTEGRLQVSKVSLAEPFRQEKELCCHLLCATERDEAQTHPVGRAVFQWCLRQLQQQRRQLIVDGRGHDAGRNESKAAAINEHEPTLGTAPTRNVDSVPGKGVSCEVQDGSIDNQETWYGVHIGSERFLVEHGIKLPTSPSDDGKGQGNSNRTPIPTTTVHFAIDGTYAGMFLLQDTIRPSAPKVLAALEAMGIALTMLTGDSVGEAARVANELDIEVLAAKSLPNEKKELIEMLKGEIPKGFRHDNEEIQMSSKGRSLANDRPESVSGRNVVAMLGDGLNDTPAQAAADVGILFSLSPLGGRRATTTTTTLALGTSAADVIIMSPDLSVLPKLIDIARKTMRQSRLNLGWAVVYNILAIGLAMGGGVAGHKIDASTAGTMMAFSSVTVLAMSLHLRQRLR